MTSSARRSEVYQDRKARQVCVDCAAGLQEDDGVRCVECEEADRDRKRLYQRSDEGRAMIKRMRANYARENAAKGLCARCPRPRTETSILCVECRALLTASTARWRARKKAGVVLLATERNRRKAEEREAIRREILEKQARDEDAPRARRVGDARRRVLRALSRLDWPSSTELMVALETGDDPLGREYNGFAVALSRLVRLGFVVRRGPRGAFEYSLTELGACEARALAEVRP